VLAYHRVKDTDFDPFHLCVSKKNFASQIEALRSVGEILPLRELVVALRKGELSTLPKRTFCLTFDDGYLDNWRAAYPILAESEAPATFFIVSGALGRERNYWWDEIARVFLMTARLPRTIELRCSEFEFSVDLGSDMELNEDRLSLHAQWQQGDAPPGPRTKALDEIAGACMRLKPGVRTELIHDLCRQAGTESAFPGGFEVLERSELAEFANAPGVEIGAHSMNHPVLTNLSEPEQRDEIVESGRFLEECLGRKVKGFAYPHGLAERDYRDEAIECVRSFGYEYACSIAIEPTAIRSDTDPFQIPRFTVQNWPANALLDCVTR